MKKPSKNSAPLRLCDGKGETSFALSTAEAISAKIALQSALEMVSGVRRQINPGLLTTQLDQAERKISLGITALRDANRSDVGSQRSEVGDQKTAKTRRRKGTK
jgi:hypothetical protein